MARRIGTLLVVALLSCSDEIGAPSTLATSTSATVPRDGRVVLVTVDGVRWQDIFESGEERLPRMQDLVASRGVALGAPHVGCGSVHTASGANLSLPGYQEIFTGHRSRCLDNHCPPVQASVLDEAANAKLSVASIGSWDALASAVSGGQGGIFVSVGQDGQASDPYPGHGQYRPDRETAEIALAYYRAASPTVFHLGLGDTDEHGHRGNYAGYLDALEHADSVIGALADLLDATGLADTTTVIITPDHGRNTDFVSHGVLHPESGRTFVLAFGGGMRVRGNACARRDITLVDIAPTIRALVGLPPAPSDGAPIEEIIE